MRGMLWKIHPDTRSVECRWSGAIVLPDFIRSPIGMRYDSKSSATSTRIQNF